MTSVSTKSIEDRLLDISKLEDMNPDSIRKMYKLKTVLDYLDAKDKNKKLTQKSLCDSLGISRSTLFRTRRDLGMSSLNRYEVPVTTEAQRKKDKVRRTVTSLYKTNVIDASERDSLRKQINENKLETAVSRIHELRSALEESKVTRVNRRGGTMKTTESDTDDDKPKIITEAEADRRIAAAAKQREGRIKERMKEVEATIESTNSDDEVERVLASRRNL